MKNNLLLAGIAACSLFLSVTSKAQSPTAAFSLSQASICAGGTIQVSDASTDTPTAWSYTVDGPAMLTSSAQNPQFTLTAAGDYSITLVATNSNGDSSPLTQTLSVAALPMVTASGPAAPVCSGDFITLTGGGASTYTWSGSVIDGNAFAITASDTYTVIGTDNVGCKNSATIPVTVNALPVLVVSSQTAICSGDDANLSVTGADTYTWVGFGNSANFTDAPTATTIYTVSGTDATTGCSSTATRNVIVNNLPSVAVNSGAVCIGDVFTMSPSGASTYTYSNGSNTIVPTANDSYTVTGVDANGCAADAVSSVTVNALPVVSVTGGTLCSGSVFTLTPTGAVNYTVQPSLSATVNPVTTTSYSVSGTDANGCISAAAAVAEVTVITFPAISVNSGSICAGGVFTITPTSTAVVTFSFVNGGTTVTPASSTNYTITGDDGSGCLSQAVSQVTVIALPVISVNSGAVCAGNVFTMVPTGAASYTFSNGSATVIPTSNTSYSVSGSTSGGCMSVAYAVANVTVNTLPVVSVTSGSICPGALYTMTASGAASYYYQGGSPVVNPTSSSSYTVTGVSAQGCLSSNTATANVTVWPVTPISLSSATAVCSGQSTTLTASGAQTYTWAANGSTLATYVVALTSNTTIVVVGSDANGCLTSASQFITVHPLPVISVNSGTTCTGKAFTITPTGASTYVYQGGSAVVMPSATTTYSVLGTDMNGCTSAAATSTVTVIHVVNMSVLGNTTICAGETTNLTAIGATTYSWDASNLTNTIAVTPATTTTYVVTGFASGCTGTTAVAVMVNALPGVNITSSSPTICVGESATLTASGAGSYFWNNNSSASFIVVHPGISTSYTVTGTDATTFCSNKFTFTQEVSECTGLAKIENNSINVSIYPNPNAGEFTVELSQETSVNIVNGIGQVVYSKMLNGDNKINLSNQPAGIYFVQLKQGNATKTLKVVKN